MIVVAASGYFNPLHVGHVHYLEEAKKLGDYLLVIVNTDRQVDLKGSCKFQSEQDRLAIIMALRCVDNATLSVDTDTTQCKTLEVWRPQIFAKGGDRYAAEIPERKVCDALGIKIIDGVGGGKIRSSSELINNQHTIDKFMKSIKV